MNIYKRLTTMYLSLVWLIGGCTLSPEQVERRLVLQNCQGCHMLPDPTQLSKKTWEFDVLPKMAAKLGQKSGDHADIQSLKEMLLFPEEPLLTPEEWLKIRNFYIKTSPVEVNKSDNTLDITLDLKDFDVGKPDLKNVQPFISLTYFDSKSQQFFVGNSSDKNLSIFDSNIGLKNNITLSGAPSFVVAVDKGYYVLTMKQVMPHNKKEGTLTFISQDNNGQFGAPEILLNDLQRPVHASIGDLDADGKEDMVIASFGNLLGELALYSNVHAHTRKKRVLRALPGAIKSVITDLNQDGLPDIIALMAQGQEGFYAYINDGKGNFQEKVIMEFPPTYGSTYFEWKDIDGDGLNDILYVNGDNGDYMPITKKFHGIRFFKNKGNMIFEESFFIEQHGVTKAITNDFDQDGDLDIAAISYFPDYQQRPEESFVYYENMGNFNFQAKSFEQTPSGKWLTMAAGDLDNDGDKDLILGSAMFLTADVPVKLANDWRRKNTPILILKNTLKSTP